MLTQCCVCKKYKWGENDYRIESPDPEEKNNISHGYCKECFNTELKKIEGENNENR